MKRTAYRLIVLLLCMAGWQMSALAYNGGGASRNVTDVAATIDRTSDNMPQWEDLGLEDLLVVSSQPTVTAPTSMRLSHEHGSPLSRNVATTHRVLHHAPRGNALPHRAQSCYIYRLLCLRL